MPKNFFTTRPSKAFLETYGTNHRNFDQTFFDNIRDNSTSQVYGAANNRTDPGPPHVDIYSPSPDQETQAPPEWYGTRLAKLQAYQEQRVFAKRQRVRFGSSSGCCGASPDEYGHDDYDEGDDDDESDGDGKKDGKQDAQSKQPWGFSQCAKNLAAKEQKLFKTMAKRCKRIEEEVEEEEDDE